MASDQVSPSAVMDEKGNLTLIHGFLFLFLIRSWNEHESGFQAKEDLVESENSQVFHS